MLQTLDNKYLLFMKINASGQVRYWAKVDELLDRLKIASSISTGINPFLEQNIQMHLNPTKDMININFGSLQYKTEIVKITNLSGKLISSNTFRNLSTAAIDLYENAKRCLYYKS